MIKNMSKIRTSTRVKILIILVSIVLIVFMFPKGVSLEFEVNINSIWLEDDLIASMPYEILKDHVVYEREKTAASNSTHQIFVKYDNVRSTVRDSVKKYNEYIISIMDSDIFLENQDGVSKTFLSENSYLTLRNIRRRENILASNSEYKMSDIFISCNDIINRIYRRGYMNVAFENIEKDSIAVREGKYQKIMPKMNYYEGNKISDFIETRLRMKIKNDELIISAAKEYLTYFILPNYIFSETLTEESKQAAINKISPNKGLVNQNERIVAKHDRVTAEVKDKIESYRKAKGVAFGFWQSIAQDVGKFLHVSIIFLLLGIYIYLFRKKIYHDNLMILLILVVILMICLMAFLVSELNVTGAIELLILLPVVSMLLTIIFDSRIGFYTTVISALLIGGIRGNDYALVVTNIVAGGLAAYTVRDIKNRNQIFRSFFFIFIGYMLGIVAFGLESFSSPEQILFNSSFAAANSLFSPALTFGLIIFVEKIFMITTDLTLLEMSDFNSPLLRDLARNAPGTFNHSMTIGAMVENAAELIGANQILSRIGAYYHDIGKLANPDGYSENQLDGNNLHESLEPSESAKLILEHVTKGIELAKKNTIPQDVIDFIPMHHGTLVVSYFYEKAKEKYGEKKVNKDDYRYPGPKPNTKETALLMLADACESAVRAMDAPDVQKVTNMVNNLIQIRIDDGQLNEAPITLGDIGKIKEAFTNILVGHHHKRIKYPQQEELENKSAEQKD